MQAPAEGVFVAARFRDKVQQCAVFGGGKRKVVPRGASFGKNRKNAPVLHAQLQQEVAEATQRRKVPAVHAGNHVKGKPPLLVQRRRHADCRRHRHKRPLVPPQRVVLRLKAVDAEAD